MIDTCRSSALRRGLRALTLFGSILEPGPMTRKSFAFLITLSVTLSASWSALAQTMSDAERILGTWKLSEIEDASGDRSSDLDLYVFDLTFYAEEDDTLKVDFLIATGGDAAPGDPVTGTYEIDQDVDSLTISLLGVFNIPAAYMFDSDAAMTLSLDSDVMNIAMALLPLFVSGFVAPDDYTGTLSYTFAAVDETGVTSVDRAGELPETSSLAQNYPNPFNPSTEIVYYLDESGPVRLEAFDMAGKRIATLVEAVLPQGEHRARFDAGGLPTGTYAYRLTVGSGAKTLTKTMTLVR